jgi:hypothetical protein
VGGVEHNDISVKILMYDKVNGDHGVLNDYDLAHLNGRRVPSGAKHTGTMPFMALDLLVDEAWGGKTTRLYRHDCESFAWVLLWICCRYNGGKEISNPPLGKFITYSYEDCFCAKYSIPYRLRYINPTPSYERFWPAANVLLSWPFHRRHDQDVRALLSGKVLEEPTIPGVIEIYRNALEECGFGDVLNTL